MEICKCALCAHERGEPDESQWFWEKRYVEEQTDNVLRRGMQLENILNACSNFDPDTLCDLLIEYLWEWQRRPGDIYAVLADMLDSEEGESPWKLELRRRHRGPPERLSNIERSKLFLEYHDRLKELQAQNHASPAKTARGELAVKYQMTDEEIRAIIDRIEGKRKRAAKRLPRSGRKYPNCAQ